MYLDTFDFMTVWSLAHNWVGRDPSLTDLDNLPDDLRQAIHRLLNAISWRYLSVRTRSRVIFEDDSFLTFVCDFKYYIKNGKCLRQEAFDKEYLDTIYVKRSEVISWCNKDYLPVPPIWEIKNQITAHAEYDASDDNNEGWYIDLTEPRKKRVACLELAKKLWLINPNQTYSEVYNHPTMKQFGNPAIFSFEAFKKWARNFAPDYAKNGGRRHENK